MSKDLMELPSTGTRETYATVQTYNTCGCRDNPQQHMAPRRRATLIREYPFVLGS